MKAPAAAINVKPRMVVFLRHKARPRPDISGSPSKTTGGGVPWDFDLRRNNIATPTHRFRGAKVMTNYYGCDRVNRRRFACKSEVLLTIRPPNPLCYPRKGRAGFIRRWRP